RLYVVGSSGLFSAIEGKKDAVKANQDALAEAIREACGLKMTFIDVTREAELSIDGVIPAKHAAVSMLLDIGSGNTKGGFRDGDHDAPRRPRALRHPDPRRRRRLPRDAVEVFRGVPQARPVYSRREGARGRREGDRAGQENFHA